MERKCEISGVVFEVGQAELDLCRKFGLLFPRRSEIERLRFFLSFVPELGCCISKDSIFSLDAQSGFVPQANLKSLTSAKFSGGDIPELSGEECFANLLELVEKWKRNPTQSTKIEGYNYCCVNCSSSVDSSFSFDSSELIECAFVNSSQRLFFARFSSNCSDCYFIENCEDCRFCLFSTNLKGKKYHVFNQPVSEDEYQSVLKSLMLDDPLQLDSARERFANFLSTQSLDVMSYYNSSDVRGRFAFDSKSSADIFLSKHILNSNLIFGSSDIEASSMVVMSSGGVKRSYQNVLLGGPSEEVFNAYHCGPNVKNLEYCVGCKNSHDLLFCVGLDGASYCIFNTQFTDKEYFVFKDELRSMFSREIDWGYQLPVNLSLIAYNESLSSLIFPLSKVQANLLGYAWNDSLDKINIDREQVADYICEISGVPYSVKTSEINIRKSLGVAVSNRSPDQRFRDVISSISLGPRRESVCGLRSNKFEHFYRGSRTVVASSC